MSFWKFSNASIILIIIVYSDSQSIINSNHTHSSSISIIQINSQNSTELSDSIGYIINQSLEKRVTDNLSDGLIHFTEDDRNNLSSTIEKSPNGSLAFENIQIIEIRKCCEKGQKLIHSNDEWLCKESFNLPTTLEINIYKSPNDENKVISEDEFPDFYKVAMPNCSRISSPFTIMNKDEIWFRILEDGQPVIGLNFWVWPIWLSVSAEHCIDHIEEHEDYNLNSSNSRDEPIEVLLYCKLEGYETYKLHRLIYGITFMISSFFLLCTILIYYIVRHSYNIHGWAQVSYFLAFLLFFITEGSRIFTKLDGLNIQLGHWCFYQAVAAQYFSLATSFTITTLGFHMLWTLWRMQPVSSSKQTKLKSIILNLLLPWGLPFICLMIGLIYNHFNNPDASKQEMGIFKFGHYRCSSPAWHVGALIQSSLLGLNIVYFIATAVTVIKSIYLTQFATGISNKRFIIESVQLLLKISLVMGVSLVISVAELLLGSENPLGWHWVFGRIVLFGLQGFWLFLGFGCTRKNWQALVRKYPNLKKLTNQKNLNMTSLNSLTSAKSAKSSKPGHF